MLKTISMEYFYLVHPNLKCISKVLHSLQKYLLSLEFSWVLHFVKKINIKIDCVFVLTYPLSSQCHKDFKIKIEIGENVKINYVSAD